MTHTLTCSLKLCIPSLVTYTNTEAEYISRNMLYLQKSRQWTVNFFYIIYSAQYMRKIQFDPVSITGLYDNIFAEQILQCYANILKSKVSKATQTKVSAHLSWGW